VEIWDGCASLWEQYIRTHRAKIDRDAREGERRDAEASNQTSDEPDHRSGGGQGPSANDSAAAAKAAKKSCMDQCWKDYTKCHQPKTGPSICQPAKQRCEKDCR
jgi:hypothetical protein